MSEKGTQLLALHVGFLDTDMAKGLDVKKSDPQRNGSPRARSTLENGSEEVLADEHTEALKRSLSTEQAHYLNPPVIA